jgi:hypothetical protein
MKRLLLLAAFACAALTLSGSAAATVVAPSSMDGWALASTDATGAGPPLYGAGAAFVSGPATPPAGTGSVHLFTGTDGGEAGAIRNTDYSGTRLDAITNLRYCTYMTLNNGQQFPYLSLEISTDGSGTLDDRIFFEPPYQTHATGNPSLPDQGATALNTWQCWDALEGGWWANSGDGGLNPGTGVKPLSDYLAVHPNATINNKPSGAGAIRLAVGYASAGDTFDGNVDKVTIGVSGTDTTYDFESVVQCTTDCYVDGTTGNDANGGASPADAKKTIQAAVNQVSPGGTVHVAAGTYAENVVVGKKVALVGAQAGIDARGRSATETIVSPASGDGIQLHGGSAESTIDGFTFAGPGKQIESTSGPIDGITIENNRFLVQSGGDGMFLNDNGVDITIDRNSFDGGGTSSTLLHLDADGFNGIWITNNWIENSAGTGLFSDGNRNVNPSLDRAPKLEGNVFDSNETGANLGRKSWTDASIAGNTFSNNLYPGLQGGIKDSTIENNVFDGNGRGGLELTGFGGSGDSTRGAQGDTVTGNTFTGNGFAQAGEAIFFSSSQYPGTIGSNVVHENNISGNAAGVVYGGSETINAECNWWGSYSGPSGDGPGSGDSVSGTTVDFTPWLTGPAPGGACNGPLAPMGVKQKVRDDLAALVPTGNKDTDKKIGDALKHLDKSLDAGLWIGSSRLDPKKGNKVFDEEKGAVKALSAIKTPPAGVTDDVNALVGADAELAQTAIDDAQAAITAHSGGNPKELGKANDELGKANDELTKAQAELNNGKPDKAIDHYKNAWAHAQKAIEHANKA